MDKRLASLDRKVDDADDRLTQKIDDLDARLGARIEAVTTKIDSLQAQMMSSRLDGRIDGEARRAP